MKTRPMDNVQEIRYCKYIRFYATKLDEIIRRKTLVINATKEVNENITDASCRAIHRPAAADSSSY
jgi:hypothetical protein